MPQYELMYLLGSHVADTDVPQISEQVKKYVQDFGGQDIRETALGKKKLAYPIKKTRNGHYVVVNFSMDADKVNQLDARIHSMDASIIRYILVNLEEHLERMGKDKVTQSKIIRKTPPAEPAPRKTDKPVLDLGGEELDKKIEEALNQDLTK